jgi:hypothetical protein
MAHLSQSLRPDRGFTPPHEISYRDVKLPRFLPLSGPSYLRREVGLPQVAQPSKGLPGDRTELTAPGGTDQPLAAIEN